MNSKSTFVNIKVESTQVIKVLGFLTTEAIPFSIKYNIAEEETKPQTIALPQKKIEPTPNMIKNEVADMVYQKYIMKNLETMPPKLEEIAEDLNMSVSHFKIWFKDIYHKPFYEFFLDKKMEHAAKLLRQGYTANKVSERIGYSHPIKFNKMFQKRHGVTPKKYQTINKKH